MKYLFGLFILSLTACNSDMLFEEVQPVSSPWPYHSEISFSFEIRDSLNHYDLLLDVNHTPEFKYENFYTKLHTIFPSGNHVENISSIELADKTGQWLADCSSSCTLELTLKENFKFREVGKYSIIIENFSREELSGINNFKLRLLHHTPTPDN